jgi:hypothetical protein
MNADLIATNIFESIGFNVSSESLQGSFAGVAGLLGTKDSQFSGWQDVGVQYHFEEALALRTLVIEMEYRCQLVSKIAALTNASSKSSDLLTSEIITRMSIQALLIARERAFFSGSKKDLSNDDATLIHNARSKEYGDLVKRSLLCTDPIPVGNFQLGLPRNHPSTDLLAMMADHIGKTLDIDRDDLSGTGPLNAILLEMAIWQKYNWIFRNSVEQLR